jgi:beta-lactamase class A
MRAILLVLIVLLSASSAHAEPAPPAALLRDEPSDPALARMVADELTGSGMATFGVAIRHLPSGRTALVNPDALFEPASLFKLPVMYEAYRQRRSGRLSLDEPLVVSEEHLAKTRPFGESVVGGGETITVDEALDLIITVSETAPALALLDRLGYAGLGPGLRALGLEHTTVDRDSTVTARDMLRFFEALARLEAVDADASREMLSRLLRQRVNDRIPSRLPAGTPVAHKTGNLPGVMHDVGLIYTPAGPVAVVLLAQDVVDDGAVRGGMARLARGLDAYARDGGFELPAGPPPLWDPALDARVRPLLARAPAIELLVVHLGTGQALTVNGDGAWPAEALARLTPRPDTPEPPTAGPGAAQAAGPSAAPTAGPSAAPAPGPSGAPAAGAGDAGTGGREAAADDRAVDEPPGDGLLAAIPAEARLAYASGEVGGGLIESALVQVEGGQYLLAARHDRAADADLPLLGATVHAYLSRCAWGHQAAGAACRP